MKENPSYVLTPDILLALKEMPSTDQVTDQVKTMLHHLMNNDLSVSNLMVKTHLNHRPYFRKNYIEPAEIAGLIEKT